MRIEFGRWGKCLVEEEKQISGANKILKIAVNIICQYILIIC